MPLFGRIVGRPRIVIGFVKRGKRLAERQDRTGIGCLFFGNQNSVVAQECS